MSFRSIPSSHYGDSGLDQVGFFCYDGGEDTDGYTHLV
jgi:hypothetical protein